LILRISEDEGGHGIESLEGGTVHPDLAGLGTEKSLHHLEKGGLPCAGRPDQADPLAGRNPETEFSKEGITAAIAIPEGDAVKLDLHHAPRIHGIAGESRPFHRFR
jgi:hypothetical protein